MPTTPYDAIGGIPRDNPNIPVTPGREWIPIDETHTDTYRRLPEGIKRQFKDWVHKQLEQVGRDYLPPTKE